MRQTGGKRSRSCISTSPLHLSSRDAGVIRRLLCTIHTHTSMSSYQSIKINKKNNDPNTQHNNNPLAQISCDEYRESCLHTTSYHKKSRLSIYSDGSLLRLDALLLGIQKQAHLALQRGLLLGPTR